MRFKERWAHRDDLERLAQHYNHPLITMTISAQAAVAELERLFALPNTRYTNESKSSSATGARTSKAVIEGAQRSTLANDDGTPRE